MTRLDSGVRRPGMHMTSPTILLGLAVALMALSLPLVFRLVPPNHFYWFRTPRTLANPGVWYRVNFFGGCALLGASIVGIILLLALPPSRYAFLELMLPFMAALVASLVYLARTA